MGKSDRYIFGIHAVQEAINAGKELEKVLVRRGIGSEPFNKLVSELHMLNVPVQQVPVEKLNRVSGKNHQGIIAFMAEISYHDIWYAFFFSYCHDVNTITYFFIVNLFYSITAAHPPSRAKSIFSVSPLFIFFVTFL